MLKRLLILVFFLTAFYQKGYTQGTVDSSLVEVRNFKSKNLEKLRNNPDFNYEENIEEYSQEDSDWEWKQWRYEQERAKSDSEIKKVRREEEPEEKPFSLGESAIYIASAIMIIFLVLALLGIDVRGLFRRNAKVNIKEIDDEENIDKLDKSNLDDKINQAINNKDYTQAIRFAYLKTLFLLSQRQYIHLQKEKTNLEYQQELRENKKTLYDDFKYQSRIFAFIKYGEFQISASQFEPIYTQFKNLHNKI